MSQAGALEIEQLGGRDPEGLGEFPNGFQARGGRLPALKRLQMFVFDLRKLGETLLCEVLFFPKLTQTLGKPHVDVRGHSEVILSELLGGGHLLNQVIRFVPQLNIRSRSGDGQKNMAGVHHGRRSSVLMVVCIAGE